jgi:uncharacterized protein
MPSETPHGFLLFSHCFTCNKDLKAIVRISRELANRGWGVLRYDFSGLGGSAGEFHRTNFTTNRADLQSAVHYMTQQGQAPSFLIGHSFGGAVSLSLADELPVIGTIAIAAPSDTIHLADLLDRMDPAIATDGTGTVTIGGRSYTIDKQMVDDFRLYDLKSMVAQMSKPLLTFHSPIDETVDFRHALINSGFASIPTLRMSQGACRSLFCLPNCNHLMTTRDQDCVLLSEVADAWCRSFLA